MPGEGDTTVMDTKDLGALVPVMMARHPAHTWTLLSGGGPGIDLEFTLYPVAAPDRVATLCVDAGAELFMFRLADHSSTGFAYTDADQRETLEERIDLAVAASRGPTRVVVVRANGVLIESSLVVDPDGLSPTKDMVTSWPIRRLKARLARRRMVREVLDFPSVAGD